MYYARFPINIMPVHFLGQCETCESIEEFMCTGYVVDLKCGCGGKLINKTNEEIRKIKRSNKENI